MKIVILERNSVGTDVSVDCISDFGEVTIYRNTVTLEEVRERVKDADIVIANKSPLNEETLKDAPNVKLICEFATGFDNCDLAYCSSRGINACIIPSALRRAFPWRLLYGDRYGDNSIHQKGEDDFWRLLRYFDDGYKNGHFGRLSRGGKFLHFDYERLCAAYKQSYPC